MTPTWPPPAPLRQTTVPNDAENRELGWGREEKRRRKKRRRKKRRRGKRRRGGGVEERRGERKYDLQLFLELQEIVYAW